MAWYRLAARRPGADGDGSRVAAAGIAARCTALPESDIGPPGCIGDTALQYAELASIEGRGMAKIVVTDRDGLQHEVEGRVGLKVMEP